MINPCNQSDRSTLNRRALLGLGSGLAAASVLGLPPTATATTTAVVNRPTGTVGDTAPGIIAVYPADAFMHNNPDAKIIDITKVEESLGAPAGTNATPNDPTDDDSGAFRYILTWLADQMREGTEEWPVPRDATNRIELSYAIYVPDGTYHVERRLTYEGPVVDEGRPGLAHFVHMRIIGQSREKTIIRLKDDSAGYGNPAKPKAVIDFSQDAAFNNESAQNVLRNVTVDTGKQNPGAIGVDYVSANNGHIDNVLIRSGDGRGRAGLQFPIGITSGYYSNIVISGFDYGIEMHAYHFINPTIEYLTLNDQNVAGILIGDCIPTFRAVRSSNRVPAVKMTGAGGHLVLLDARFEGGIQANPAIDFGAGHLFARDIDVDGYGAAVATGGITVVDGDIDEYVSGEVITFDDRQPTTSMRLPVQDVPTPAWPDPQTWASVDDFGAVGEEDVDDTAAIQAAMESGAAVVYFPKQAYWLDGTVDVPATVQHIQGAFTSLLSFGGVEMFDVTENANTALTVSDINRVGGGSDQYVGAPLLRHTATRTVSMHTIRAGGKLSGQLYLNNETGPNGDLFLTNTNGIKPQHGTWRNQRVWARWEDTEQIDFYNHGVGAGAEVWVLGYKVEGGTPNFVVTDGGRLEVLGGVCNSYRGQSWNDDGAEDVAFIIEDGEATIVTSSNGQNRPHVDELDGQFHLVIRDGDNEVHWDELPERTGRQHQWVIPLYVHRNN